VISIIKREEAAMPDVAVMIKNTTYKPGWKFRYETESWRELLIITAALPDARDFSNGICEFTMKRTIPGYLRANPSEETYLTWLKEQIREIEFHEISEFLRYENALVEDPHAGAPVGV
jgi:hypothetical protein